MSKFKNNTVELIAEYRIVSHRLLTERFSGVYDHKLAQLYEYNKKSENIEYWNRSYKSLCESISSLKSEWGSVFKSEFIKIDFALDKIKYLRDQESEIQKTELYLYIDYFVLKTTKLLFAIENEKILSKE